MLPQAPPSFVSLLDQNSPKQVAARRHWGNLGIPRVEVGIFLAIAALDAGILLRAKIVKSHSGLGWNHNRRLEDLQSLPKLAQAFTAHSVTLTNLDVQENAYWY